MKNTNIKNAGYLLLFMPPILLVIGTYSGYCWIPVIFFFVLLPLVRLVVGDDFSAPNKQPSKLLTFYLHGIPRLYFAVWVILLFWSIWIVAYMPMEWYQYIGFSLGLWIVTSINTAVAHELIHDRNRFDRYLGSLLEASIGYFHFAEEHLYHHSTNGHYYEGDAAKPGTSVYRFAYSRYLNTFQTAWNYEIARLKRVKGTWFDNRLLRRVTIPIAIAAAFYAFAGLIGLTIYIFIIIGTAFSVQAITYLQHWGLSEKENPSLADYGFAWEDGCWIQACVILNMSFHGQHHLRISKRYYELELVEGGIRLPSGYAAMFVLALFPSYFNKIMSERLATWIDQHEKGNIFPQKSSCLGLESMVKSLINAKS